MTKIILSVFSNMVRVLDVLTGMGKPKLHYTDFHRNFPTGKVMDTNHESRVHKR